MTTITFIHDEAWVGHQSKNLLELLRLSGSSDAFTLRVHVHVDAYVQQSWATIEVWTNKGWKKLLTRAGEMLRSKNIVYATPMTSDDIDLMKKDRDDLVRLADEVLFG